MIEPIDGKPCTLSAIQAASSLCLESIQSFGVTRSFKRVVVVFAGRPVATGSLATQWIDAHWAWRHGIQARSA